MECALGSKLVRVTGSGTVSLYTCMPPCLPTFTVVPVTLIFSTRSLTLGQGLFEPTWLLVVSGSTWLGIKLFGFSRVPGGSAMFQFLGRLRGGGSPSFTFDVSIGLV